MASSENPGNEYIHIHPSVEPIGRQSASTIFRTLRRLTPDQPRYTKYLPGLFDPEPYTYEWLVTATPQQTGTGLQYFAGTGGQLNRNTLKPHLRSLFPDSYDLTNESRAPLTQFPDTEWEYAVEAVGTPTLYSDWYTGLNPFDSPDESDDPLPMTTILQVLQDTDTPCVFQVCFQRSEKLDDTFSIKDDLRRGCTTPIANWGSADKQPKSELPSECRNRLTHVEKKEADGFAVSVRVLVGEGPTARATADQLASAMGSLGGEYYKITGKRHQQTDQIAEAIRNQRVHPPDYSYTPEWFPLETDTSKGIVADATEIGNFCLIDGGSVTEPAVRALDTQSETTGFNTPPSPETLNQYDHGFPLGHVRNSEGEREEIPVGLPPALQRRHILFAGVSGAGKSISLTNAILDNYIATGGADIVVDPKGDKMVTSLVRSHYMQHGDLDDVYWFDCAETLPALSILDIRPELEAGIPRESAVANAIDRYIELLRSLLPDGQYDDAVRSPDIIRFICKALFDPVHGEDALSHADVKEAAIRLQDEQTMPPVTNDALARDFATIVNTDTRTFQKLMGGVMSRLDTVSQDERLRALFNHTPDETTDGFDIVELLNEDALIILDMGGLQSNVQPAVMQVMLSNLWSALKRRARRTEDHEQADPPLVNLYLEEAAAFAELDLLGELLDQSRSFGVGLTLAVQFPGQFRETNPDTHERILNNVGTMVAGYVQHDRALAETLATDRETADAVADWLNTHQSDNWLVSLPPTFGTAEPDPFEVEALSPPVGHPAADEYEEVPTAEVETAIENRNDTVTTEYGIDITDRRPATAATTSTTSTRDGDGMPMIATNPLAYTERLPPTVAYDGERAALKCTECGAFYDPTESGMVAAIQCHDSLAAVDRANIPVCDVSLNLTQIECDQTPYTHRQLLFLQTVYNAQSLQYDSPYYDIVHDSMLRLREYLGIDQAAVRELIDDGLLKRDGQKPHLLYTVTGDGRTMLNEAHREGVDYGHGVGDLEETSEHRMMVETLVRHLRAEYVADDKSSVTEVCRYYEPGTESSPTVSAASAMGEDGDPQADADQTDRRRFDVVGLDDAGEIVIAGEAERCNNDVQEAAVADFDKMAAYDPEESIWVVPSRSAGAEIVAALFDPPSGPERVGTEYSANTAPKQYGIDTAGLSSMMTINTLRDELPE